MIEGSNQAYLQRVQSNRIMRKPVFGVSVQVQHKLGTEDDYMA